jgi:hypothetical protein
MQPASGFHIDQAALPDASWAAIRTAIELAPDPRFSAAMCRKRKAIQPRR